MPLDNPGQAHTRHDETAWRLSGQHTGLANIRLTDRGEVPEIQFEDVSNADRRITVKRIEAKNHAPGCGSLRLGYSLAVRVLRRCTEDALLHAADAHRARAQRS